MNGMLQNFEKLLEKMRFREPVPPQVARYVLDYKMKSLVLTLKNFNEYGVVYGFVLRIYFSAKKLGIRLSVAQSKVAAGLISIILVGSLTAGILYYTRHLAFLKTSNKIEKRENKNNLDDSFDKKKEMNINPIDKKDIEERMKKENFQNRESAGMGKYRLGVDIFKSDAVDKDEIQKITSTVADELIRLKGKNKIVRLNNENRKNSNFVLLGAVEKLGGTYIITAKIINVENSKLIFTLSDTADTKDEINAACSRMAKKIALSME